MWQWQITDFETGRSVLEALALRVPAAPRAFLRQAIRKGRIRCDTRTLAAEETVTGGMYLTIATSSRFEELAGTCGIDPQSILFEDQHALVVFKPAGLAVHQAAGHDDNLANRVARFIALRHAPYRTAPVHRLDIGTSGPVLFGKGRQATGRFGQLLMDGQIRKHYLALVGAVVPVAGELVTPVPDQGLLKPARTIFRRLACSGRYCLVELDLVTGRPHQARRQLADAGWPIVGDRRYDGPSLAGLNHPFLHCQRLTFPRLDTQTIHQTECPLPGFLGELLAAVGIAAGPGFDGDAENSAASVKDKV